VAAPPLDSPCDRPVTYPEDSKTLVKSSKEIFSIFHNYSQCFAGTLSVAPLPSAFISSTYRTILTTNFPKHIFCDNIIY